MLSTGAPLEGPSEVADAIVYYTVMAEDRPVTKTSPAIRKERGLRQLSTLLAQLRALDALSEVRPGNFQRKSRAFLHFHYHPDGTLIADVRFEDWERFDVTSRTGQDELIAAIRQSITAD